MSSTAVDLKRIPEQPVGVLHVVLILGLCVGGAVLLGAILWQGDEKTDLEIYLALLLFYAAASTVFVRSYFRGGHLPLFDLPVFLTVLCFIRFGLVPLAAFFDPADFLKPGTQPVGYGDLNRNLFLFILGMLVFWVGCRMCRRTVTKTPERNATKPERSQVPLAWAIALFVVSLAVKIYITNNYGWGYGLDPGAYSDNLALMQVLMNVEGLGIMALALACIEACYHARSHFRKVVFVIIFINEVFWGALSGMKEDVFRNFLLVAAIVTLTRAKIEKKWVAAVLLGFVVVYPIQDRYRSLLRSGTIDIRGVGALRRAANTAAQETVRQESGWAGWLHDGLIETAGRLDLLHPMAITSSLDSWQASRVRGDERWWMIPIYPFVPRFLWPSKPVLARGGMLSRVLGYGTSTSTALTYPGDLYMDYGAVGVLIGMLALGMACQLITKRLTGRPGKGALFFYSGLFLFAINVFEADAFSVWVSLIKVSVIMTVMTYLIYGSRPATNLGRALRHASRSRDCQNGRAASGAPRNWRCSEERSACSKYFGVTSASSSFDIQLRPWTKGVNTIRKPTSLVLQPVCLIWLEPAFRAPRHGHRRINLIAIASRSPTPSLPTSAFDTKRAPN